MFVRVVRVVADEIRQRHQVPHLTIALESQAVCRVHRTVEGRVAGQGALDPPERLVEPAVVGQGAGDVGVHREVVRVVLDGAAQRGERLPGPAGAA